MPCETRQPDRHLTRRACFGLATGAAAALAGAGAEAGAEPRPRLAVTRHTTTIGGRPVAYGARVGETHVPDPAGRPAAAVVTIAYFRSDVRDRRRRPVIFCFNGGPGASSSPLHMRAMGPVVRDAAGPGDRSQTALLTNAFSPLDVADLVFIDPVSTGFSRAFPGVDPKPFYNTRFDAITMAEVIKTWLRENGREASPRYLAGESYGTTRAPLILRHAPDLRFDGVLLISGGGSWEGPNANDINGLPTMAAAAWYHERIPRRGRTVEQVVDEATAFATGDYAAVLAKADLDAAGRRRMAERMSEFIGLPADLIEARGLRVSQNVFMFNLLKDRGLRIGKLDTRITAPLVENAQGAIDDPALNVVKTTPGAPPPTPASLGAIESPVVGRYVRERLGFPSADPYYGVNFTANSQWVWEPAPRSAEIMAEAMARDPQLRLFSTMGVYDLGAADGPGFDQAGVPKARLTLQRLAGPHEVYDGEANRAAFNDAVRRFVTHGPVAPTEGAALSMHDNGAMVPRTK